jgi:hypothetical protein
MLYGMYGANRARQAAGKPAPISDPFASQRQQYQEQLSRLSSDPSYLTQLPGYKAGLEATRRASAAGGYNMSGNELAALQDYGGKTFQNESNRLAHLAGADINPMVAGRSPLDGEIASADLVSRSLATLGYTARGMGY